MKNAICLLLLATFVALNCSAQTTPTPAIKSTGNFSVSDAGSAQYSIPIFLPPGTGGMKPELSLNYNSNGGNGIMGLGWGLSGMSVISRGGKTIAQDGVAEGVKFTRNDVYYLDGERLVQLNRDKNYGAADAEYGTETNSFMKVISRSSLGEGPEYFEAFTKTGLKMTFGSTDNSRVYVPGTSSVLYYLLAKIEENRSSEKGNYMTYEYDKDENNASYRPLRIRYTRNDNAAPGSTNLTEVFFDYDSRNDVTLGYINGIKSSISNVLKRIDVRHKGVIQERYYLNYIEHSVTKQKLLSTFLHCANGGLTCADPITFEWDTNELDLSFIAKDTPIPQSSLKGDSIVVYSQDLNNDGLSDVIIADRNGPGKTVTIEYYLNRGATNFSKIETNITTVPENSNFNFVDVNADGFVDLVITNPNGTILWNINPTNLKIGGSNQFRAIPNPIPISEFQNVNLKKQFFFIDINADSRLDFLILDSETGNSYLYENRSDKDNVLLLVKNNKSLGFSTSAQDIKNLIFVAVDLDNDGKTDFLAYSRDDRDGSNKLYRNDNTANSNSIFVLSPNSLEKRWFNVYPDTYQNSGLNVAKNYAYNGFEYRIDNSSNNENILTPKFSGIRNPIFTDLNGDGLLDLVISKTHNHFYQANNVDIRYTQTEKIFTLINKGNFTFEGDNIISSPNSGISQDPGDIKCNPTKCNNDQCVLGYFNAYLGYNSGGGFFTRYTSSGQANKITIQWEHSKDFVDINGDGKSDLIVRYDDQDVLIKTKQNNQGVLCNAIGQYFTYSKDFAMIYGRFNRFGTDIFLYNKKDGSNVLQKNVQDGRPPVIVGFKGHLGSELINVNYVSLNDSSVYTKGNGRTYPDIDFSSSGMVVKRWTSYVTKTEEGSFGTKYFSVPIADLSYKYSDGVLNLTGRGFRGFKKLEITDNIQKYKSVKEFEQDSRLIGANLKTSKTYAPNGALLSEEIYKNAQIWNRSNGTGGTYYPFNITTPIQDTIFTPYPFETVSRAYDLTGTKLIENKSRLLLDGFGNVLYQVYEHGDGCIDSIVHEYSNDYSKWFIGRLTKSTVFKSCQGANPVVRESSFEYHPITGLLIKEILEPNQDEKIRTIKTYEHDLFGNIVKTTETAWNGSQVVSRSKTVKFSADGRFQIETTNHLGHKVSQKFDDYRGHPVESTDENGLVTKMEYSAFGILQKTTFPDGNYVQPNITQDYTNGFPAISYGMTAATKGSNMPISEMKMDLAGRVYETSHSTFSDFGERPVSTKVYSADNRVESETDPYYKSFPKPEGPKLTAYEYDLVGRIKKVTQTGNNGDVLTDVYNYTGLAESITNPLSQTMTSVQDVRKRMLKTIDNSNNQVNYKYNTEGQLKQVIAGNDEYVINYEYDLRGRMTSMTDPVVGREEFSYDGFGNLLTKKDGKGNLITYSYDNLDRVTSISQKEGIVTFTYDVGNKGVGKPSKVTYTNYESNLVYDNLGRLSQNTIIIGGKSHVYKYFYNAIGKVDRIEHPSGITLKYHYNSTFFLYKITNNTTTKVLWEQLGADEKNRITQETYGNGIITTYTYDIQDNLTAIKSEKGAATITDLRYEYNALNYKTKKSDVKNNITEAYTYDDLNRLTNVVTTGITNSELTMTYDKWGNFVTKSDLGTYYYNKNIPTLLERIDFVNKECNLPSSKFNYEYTSFNKISKITGDSVRLEITYGPDNQRLTQHLYVNNKLEESRIYVAGDYELLVFNNVETKRMSIAGTTGIAVVYEVTGTQSGKFTYLHKDDQGSVVCITNDLGAIQYLYEYDVWGKRLITQHSESLYGKTYRGYTGHEHIAMLELINMNGRIYDPVMARFISPDPYIQSISSFQNFNRFSYVFNNPVNLVDPSGYISLRKLTNRATKSVAQTFHRVTSGLSQIANGQIRDGLKNLGQATIDSYVKAFGIKELHHRGAKVFGAETWNQIVVASATIAVAYGTAGMGAGFVGAAGSTILSGAAAGAAGGALSAHLAGAGTNDILKAGFKGSVIGGISAGLTYGVGHNGFIEGLTAKGAGLSSNIIGEGLRAIGHGMVQGTMNELQGGKFSQGFFNGMVTSIGSHAGNLYGTNSAVRVFSASMVGGAMSSITGGKFATGAVTGAFVEMYNLQGKSLAKAYLEQAKDQIVDKASEVQIGSGYTPSGWTPTGTITDYMTDPDYPAGLQLGEYVKNKYFPNQPRMPVKDIEIKPIPCITCNPNLF